MWTRNINSKFIWKHKYAKILSRTYNVTFEIIYHFKISYHVFKYFGMCRLRLPFTCCICDLCVYFFVFWNSQMKNAQNWEKKERNSIWSHVAREAEKVAYRCRCRYRHKNKQSFEKERQKKKQHEDEIESVSSTLNFRNVSTTMVTVSTVDVDKYVSFYSFECMWMMCILYNSVVFTVYLCGVRCARM